MFSKKPKIQVIKVKNVKRDVIEEEVTQDTYNYMHSIKHEKTKTSKKVDISIVLFTKDGELFSREFNGDWDLEDIKHWEKA